MGILTKAVHKYECCRKQPRRWLRSIFRLKQSIPLIIHLYSRPNPSSRPCFRRLISHPASQVQAQLRAPHFLRESARTVSIYILQIQGPR